MPAESTMAALLHDWLPRQRWFAGKDRPVTEVSLGTATELLPGDPGLRHLVLDVRQGDIVDHYQVLLGTRRVLPDRLAHAEIGRVGEGHDATHVYDAVHDPELNRALLAGVAEEAAVGPLRFRRVPDTAIDLSAPGTPMSAEQSNTSLVYGETHICKLFRRLSPGPSPDLEINLALSELGCPHVPAVHGWIELATADGGEPVTLALLSEFLRGGGDGWRLATTSVRDWFAMPMTRGAEPYPGAPARRPNGSYTAADPGWAGGDFAAEAERLGAATAAVHRDLARAFGVTEVGAEHVREMAQAMRRQLDEVAADVPELAPHAGAIGATFDALAERTEPLTLQRVHGDLHLGQAMRTGHGWTLLDFEGEPARTPEERRALGHPLRDVAGMLRSFEYAARFLHADEGHAPPAVALEQERRALAWAERNREAFCRGYAAAGGPDPAAHRVLTRALEFDKAVYEIRYEARNRPSWLTVPLHSLAHLTAR
ncbi:maltokinase N-terminal cap-like domain-containing protein [Actinomadura kijaniata]|uniref:maltokinase N-terminal cap-like domain-containing protein n=1 Tax=Actinomadura kijaniata TaxID=46161 RepID=UPI000AA96998|nr:aminoglycoside phosphotransferase [Actinomadura kijaniata]